MNSQTPHNLKTKLALMPQVIQINNLNLRILINGRSDIILQVGRSLGQGTFGKVRLGTHVLTGESVAIKILEKEKIKDQADVERVTREIHILKIVRHPNIIETSKQLFLIMEYAGGGELFDYIVKRKRLKEVDACKFFQQIISGVEYIHKVRICHRDLKPENLLLDDKNNIKLVDFGLSNTYKDGETLKTACGSPCYAAPEMIAGKRYYGLNSDIWSCGIILYAMVCGYLPFEDPNTNKLYKKILNCDYLIPGFITGQCKDLIKKILNTDPLTRFTIKDIRNHEWFQQSKNLELEGIIVGKDRIPIIEEFLGKLDEHFQQELLSQAVTFVQNNKHNQVTSTYYLIMRKQERENGKNYVYEQVTRDKKRNLYSTSNLTNFNSQSPQNKITTPAKVIMNQTVSGGFFKQSDVSKTDSKTQRLDSFGNTNPATKKYLEQMEKFYQKRNENSAQTRFRDYIPEKAKSGNYVLDQNLNQSLQMQPQNTALMRITQSQSPQQLNDQDSKKNNYMSAQPVQQTSNNYQFFMAERLKKTQNPVRAQSYDETPGIITSNNDSRIQEILPSVQNTGTNQAVQMRQTMYNQSGVSKGLKLSLGLQQNSTNAYKENQQLMSINLVNQNTQQISNLSNLLKTNYGNGFQTTVNQNTNVNTITRALAQSKVRKYRIQKQNDTPLEISINQNNVSDIQDIANINGAQAMMHIRKTSNNSTTQNGGQKIMDIQYVNNFKIKPKQLKIGSSKNSNNTSRPDPNQSMEQSLNGTVIMQSENTQRISNINNSFTAAPSQTASRFYNPHKHNRFLSNMHKQNNNNAVLYQNNFVIPLTQNQNGLNKTFYNSKVTRIPQNVIAAASNGSP